MEILATNAQPDQHLLSIKLFAKDLVLLLAFHLAERISSLLRQVLDHPTKVLYDPENEVPQFWLLPIYRELLNTASRIRPSRDSELRRSASGLVKILCKPSDSAAGGKGSKKGKLLKQGSSLARFTEWFGSMSLMNTLYVWFPASWGPSVVEAISKRNQTRLAQHPVQRPNDVLYVSPTIFTFACDVSISLWLIPPPWGVGILGLRHLALDHCA